MFIPFACKVSEERALEHDPGEIPQGDLPQGGVAADLLLALQDEPLALRALEPEGDVYLIVQAEIRQDGRQRASEAELSSTRDLDSGSMVSVGQVGLGVIWAKGCAAQK